VTDLENAYILTDDDLDYVHDRSLTLAAYAERTGQTEVAAFVELNRNHRGPVQFWHPGLNRSMDAVEAAALLGQDTRRARIVARRTGCGPAKSRLFSDLPPLTPQGVTLRYASP